MIEAKVDDTAQAIAALKEGQVIIFPTDTVYGIGVAVEHASSPRQIYDFKRRDEGKPIAWLVGGMHDLARYGKDVPDDAFKLANRYWPGALTLIVKASDAVPGVFRAQDGTIALRMPKSRMALELIGEVGPIATSSANLSGDASSGGLDGIPEELLEKAAAVVRDDGAGSGVASTVVDCSKGELFVLRQGDVMATQTFTVPIEYASRDGKTTINAKLWTNAAFGSEGQAGTAKPKAVIQIVHGMAEYIDRYDDLAEYLVGRGFVVCAEDHIGHGRSAAGPEEYGHMPAHGGKDILLGDAHELYRIVHGVFPDVPYVLYGHSMGSFIARAYLCRFGEELAACVLSGTGNVAPALSRFGRTLARAQAAVRGETYRSKMIDNMGAGAYGKQIENARTPLDWLSTDPAVVDKYIEDELCGFMFTVGGYATLLDLTAEVATPECAAKVPRELPVLFVAGDGDPVGDMGRGVQAAAQLMKDASVHSVDVKIYPGMRHEIHNEVGHDQVYDDVASWIEAHV